MGDGKAKYNIKAVSTILGIQPGTLRAWERRYNIIEPIRNESGHRLYSDEHIAILRWLLDKVNKGFTIGQAVGLLENGNVDLELQGEQQHNNKLKALALDLEESLLSFQEFRANNILNEAFNLFSIEKVVIDVIGEVLRSIGDKWEKDHISVAHEHYATQYLKTRITIILHHLQIDPLLPKAVAVCGPNERHELGLLIFTLFLRRKGYEVIYLGTSVPTDDLKLVIEEVCPKYLFISCTLVDHISETLAVVREIEPIVLNLKIGIGGNAFAKISKRKAEEFNKHLVGNTKEEWEEWLKISP
jgi:MerR family transcriptional regulator, light-induced transcriptional regulator